MGDIEVLKDKYWSKSDAFLLPLTGLVRDMKYVAKSFLFWEDYTIENYHLVVKFLHKNSDLFDKYCKDYIFPAMKGNTAVLENYSCVGGDVFVLDMSEWGEDIDMLLIGKYSKISDDAKSVIKNYHRKKDNSVPLYIYASLYPFQQLDLLGGKSSISYVSKLYGLDIEELSKLGELASVYDRKEETLNESCEENV